MIARLHRAVVLTAVAVIVVATAAPVMGMDTTLSLTTEKQAGVAPAGGVSTAVLEPTLPAKTGAGPELAVVDTTVADHEALARAAREAGMDVVNVSSAAEVTAALAERSNLAAVHVMSHGATGTVYIGDDTISTSTLDQYSELTEALDASLAADGDLLLYGCLVARDGAGSAFVTAMSTATGADVAASEDLTGNADSGGNWALESEVGVVEARPLAQVDGFDGVLTTTTFDFEDGVSDFGSQAIRDEEPAGTLVITATGNDMIRATEDGDAISGTESAETAGDVSQLTFRLVGNATFDLIEFTVYSTSDEDLIYSANGANESITYYQYNNKIEDVSGDSRFQSITSFTLTTDSGDGKMDITVDDIVLENIQEVVNTPPTLSTTGDDPTFTEEGDAVSLFSDTSVDTGEFGQNIRRFEFEVTDVSDGSDEVITLDGSSIPLEGGRGGTTSNNGLDYDTLNTGGTTVRVDIDSFSVTPSTFESIIDGMMYQNNNNFDPSTDDRVVTLTWIYDDGGSDNGGGDVSTPYIPSNVTVLAVNDAPSISFGSDQSVGNTTTEQTVDGFATGFDPVESGQSLSDFIVTNNDNSLFATQPDIDTNGNLTYTPAADVAGTATVSAQVVDDGGTANGGENTSADQTFTITVDNTAPEFDSDATVSIAEGSTGNVLDVQAGDDGTGSPDVNVDYALDGVDAGPFSIVTVDGTLSLDSAQDFESPGDDNGDNDYNLTVTATDDAGNTAEQSVTISITNVNEAPTAPTDSDGAADEVAETATNGTGVGVDAATTDPEGDAITWSLDDDANGRFEINSSGVVTVADTTKLDYESATSHTITVNASDGSLFATTAFTITVTDSDETPTFVSGASATVTESAAGGSTVLDVNATVSSTNDTGVGYAITAGNDDVAGDGGGAFAIDATTGLLTINDVDDIDETVQSSFMLTIEASEGTENATQAVTITVVDDVDPTLTSSDPADGSTDHIPGDDLTITFSEPVDFGTGLITLRKNDTGFSDAETFDVTADTGTSDGTVSISGTQLTINPTDDLTADTEYAIQIAATAITDTAATPNTYAGIGNDDDLDFTTADTRPSFAQAAGGTISVSVAEDGTLDLTSALEVDDISASDTLTWSLPTGAPNASNGTVSNVDTESVSFTSGTNHTLASGPEYVPTPDFASSASVDDSFDVRVTDGEGYTATVTVEIDIQEVNDAPTLTLGDDRTVNGTTSQQTVAEFASFGPGGGSDEDSQTVEAYTVTVASDPDGVLSAVGINTDGNLSYTANDSVEGTATVAVAVTDNGGTANGGTNTSATATFEITVDTRSPTVESASTTARTLTVTMDEPLSEAAATTPPSENFTVTADGSRINVSTVTISGSTISLDLDSRISFGETVTFNYTRGTNIAEDLATNQLANVSDQPVTNTVSRPNRGGGAGGGGGGSSQADRTAPVVTTEQRADGTTGSTITTNARAGQPVTLGREDGQPLSQGGRTSVDSLSVTTTTDRDFSVSVSSSAAVPDNNDGAIALSRDSDGADPIEYLQIDHDFADEDVSEATISFSVSADEQQGSGEITLFRNVGGEWVPLETTLVSQSGGVSRYEAITPGFSVFAIGTTDRLESPQTDAQASESPATESPPDAQTTDETPGFGVGVGLLAVLAVTLLIRRRTTE